MIYESVPNDMLLTQGDLFDGCAVLRLRENGRIESFTHRVIVLTQACDIAQQKRIRSWSQWFARRRR